MRHRYILLIFLACQTLGDAARREAERRKALAEQGIEVKVIERAGTPTDASHAPKPRPSGTQPATRGNDRFRTTVQKLDRDIRQVEDRLELLRRRLDREKSFTRGSRPRNTTGPEEKLAREIDDLGLKLKRLQSERRDAYNAARKSGLLPGEIDGKGITP